jgi:hypothetical protein
MLKKPQQSKGRKVYAHENEVFTGLQGLEGIYRNKELAGGQKGSYSAVGSDL